MVLSSRSSSCRVRSYRALTREYSLESWRASASLTVRTSILPITLFSVSMNGSVIQKFIVSSTILSGLDERILVGELACLGVIDREDVNLAYHTLQRLDEWFCHPEVHRVEYDPIGP